MATITQMLEKSLKDQLKRKGADEYHFFKLVDDYCRLFDMKRKLQEDVEKNGVTLTEFNTSGNKVHKTNPAIAEITKINASMLKILSTLGINAENNIKNDGDNDDCGL